jgi:hypothetical protein
MPPAYRVTAVPPDGKQKYKTISLKRYSEEEAIVIAAEWKKAIEAGLPFKMPSPTPKVAIKSKDDDSSSDDEKKPIAKPLESAKGLTIPRFNIDDLELPDGGGVSFALLGSTRSGKSTLMLHLWETLFKKHVTILLTHNPHVNIYKPLAKSAAIAPDFYPELINIPMKINRECKNHYKFCLIFDDLSNTGKNDVEMTKLLTIGRNTGMSAMICGQRMEMLNSTGRTNVNYVCCFRLNTDTAIRDVVETYLRSYFPPGMPISEMCRIYKELTADHQFIFVNTLLDTIHLCKLKI